MHISFREFDRKLIAAVDKLPDWVHPIMTGASFIGSPPAMIAIFAAMLIATFAQGNRSILRAELWMILALPLAAILKLVTQRVRPDTLYVHNMRFKTYSFPSGHSYTSLLVFGFLAYLAIRFWPHPWGVVTAVVLGLLTLLIGVSRIYLGAHFPTDVLGGWLIAGIVLWLIIKFAVRA